MFQRSLLCFEEAPTSDLIWPLCAEELDCKVVSVASAVSGCRSKECGIVLYSERPWGLGYGAHGALDTTVASKQLRPQPFPWTTVPPLLAQIKWAGIEPDLSKSRRHVMPPSASASIVTPSLVDGDTSAMNSSYLDIYDARHPLAR